MSGLYSFLRLYMHATDIKNRLIFGFGFTLALLLILLAVGLTTMGFMQQQLEIIVQNHNVKSELVSEMRQVEKERSIILYRLMNLVNPEERDSDIRKFNDLYKQFSVARNSLLSLGVTAQEKALLDKQSEWSRYAVSLQDQVINYLVNDNIPAARTLLYEKEEQEQKRVLDVLDELLMLQKNANQYAQSKATENYQNARLLMIVIGVAVFLVGIAVAIVVIERTVQSEANLFHQKEQAQVTLHSIGEGVITTDADGKIIYINPVAQQLTGWSAIKAKGQHILSVFAIVDEEGEAPKLDPVQKAIQEKTIVNSSEAMLLFREGGKHYAVEYTAAPIRDAEETVNGAVLVFRNITAMRNLAHQLSHQAMHDSLTGLINRREFEKRLERALRLSRTTNQRHVLCYMDLDLFKIVNDTCGHIAGDELLKQVSRLLHKKVRKTDTLARLGGDEFGLLFFNCGLEKALDVVNALRKAVKEYRFVWGDTAFEIGVSIGLVEVTAQSGGMSHIMSAADTACFVAKDLGRNRYYVFQPDDAELNLRRKEMQWLPRIQKALQDGDFELFYQKIQPLVTSQSGNIQHNVQHNEILIRMIDEDSNFLPPKAFIPIAERYDLMPAIDRWVVEAAFKQLQYASEAVPQIWAINLSGQTLTDDKFYQFVLEKTAKYRINPKTVCFEITETAAVTNLSSASELITKLRDQGFRFALDDFGSGLSSFTYLKNLPVEYLKIDGSFIRDMLHDPINTAMVESINEIGHVMGLKTIAEFVENEFINEKLRKLKVDYVQGYGIHKPEPFNLYSGLAEQVR